MGDEKLATIRTRSRVSHREETSTCMSEIRHELISKVITRTTRTRS